MSSEDLNDEVFDKVREALETTLELVYSGADFSERVQSGITFAVLLSMISDNMALAIANASGDKPSAQEVKDAILSAPWDLNIDDALRRIVPEDDAREAEPAGAS